MDAERRRSVAAYLPLFLVLATLLCYWPVCGNEFVTWDDPQNVTVNPYLHPPSFANLAHFWSLTYEQGVLPLTYTVWSALALVAQVQTPDAAGQSLNPYVFHAANLILHCASVVLMYLLLKRLIGRAWPSAAGAALFAIHPLQVEPVAWVTGMKDILAGFFSLVTLLCYVIAAQQSLPAEKEKPSSLNPAGAGANHRASARTYGLLASLAFVAALLSKPGTVTIPLLAIILDRWVIGRSWKRVLLLPSAWLALSAVSMAHTTLSGVWHHVTAHVPIYDRPLIAADALAFYLRKLVLPVGLTTLYPHSPSQMLAGRLIWIIWVVPVAVAVFAWLMRKRAPTLWAGMLIFFVAPLPVLGLVAFDHQRYSTVADRYVYVAMLGPGLALAGLLGKLRPTRRPLVAIAILVGLATLGAMSFAQTGVWHDSQHLFSRVLQINANSDVAYAHLAEESLALGDFTAAEQQALRAIALDPNQFAPYLTLGTALNRQHRYAEEASAYRQAYQASPIEVSQLVRKALQVAPNDPDFKRIRQAIGLHLKTPALAPSQATTGPE
jgi:hypothetical protein